MMNQRTFPYLVSRRKEEKVSSPRHSENTFDLVAARRLSDKASLLRPLQDEHLLEVYREAKKLNLSSEFIELLEDALSKRKLEHYKEA